MAIVGSISGSGTIGVSGSVIIANETSARFPAFPGPDVSFFVSGAIGGKGGSARNVGLFGGDLHVSGALTVGTGSVKITTNDVQFGSFGLRIEKNGTDLKFFDGTNTGGKTLTELAAASSPGAYQELFTDPVAGYINTTGSVSFAGALGDSHLTTAKGTDVFFFVSGAAGQAGDKSALFGGNLITSGVLAVKDSVGGYSTIISDAVYVGGNGGGYSSGGTTLGYSGSITAAGIITGSRINTIDGIITSTASTATLFSGPTTINIGNASAAVNVPGNFDVNGTSDLAGNVTLSGNSQFVVHTGTGNLTLSSSNGSVIVEDVTFTGGSVTIPGDLTVQGTTTTVSTDNLTVEDAIIYLANNAASSNQDGGIAIASGSSVANQALVIGRAAADVWGVGRLDVTSGTTTSLTGMTYVPMRASAFQLGSADAHVTATSNDIVVSGSSLTLQVGSTGTTFKTNTVSSLSITGITSPISATIIDALSKAAIISGSSITLAAPSGVSFGEDAATMFLNVGKGAFGSSSASALLLGQNSNDVSIRGAQILLGVDSGNTHVGTITSTGFMPAADITFNLGSPSARWANMYTGDLHLRNERGDYTLIEEENFLTIRYNKNGKRYKFLVEAVPELDEV